MTLRAINARRAGQCRCGASFGRGEAIQWDAATNTVVGCFTCKRYDVFTATEQRKAAPDQSDSAYEDQCARACGLDGNDRQN